MSAGRWALAGTILAAGVWLATRASAEPPFVPFPPSLGTLGPMGGGGGGGGGTITGGGVSGQVAFWNGLTNIVGDTGFTYTTLAGLVGNDLGTGALDLRWETDLNVNGIFLDVSAETIDLVGGSAATGCTIDALGNLACAGTVSGSGTLAGSGVAGQVTFFSAGTTVAGDVGLTYNSGTDALTLAGDLLYAGRLAATVRQTGTCAAGVLALDPTEAYVDIDPAGAACVVTIAETSALLGTDVTISITASAGAGTVTFPDVAGVHNGPTLCTITGLIIDGVYTITYVDKANDTFLGKACVQN